MGAFKTIAEQQRQVAESGAGAREQCEGSMAGLAAARAAMAEQTRAAKAAAAGLDAKVLIAAARQTGAYVDSDPIIELELTVMRSGQPPYQATIRQIVPLRHLPKIQPGNMVLAKLDADDPRKIWIDLAGS